MNFRIKSIAVGLVFGFFSFLWLMAATLPNIDLDNRAAPPGQIFLQQGMDVATFIGPIVFFVLLQISLRVDSEQEIWSLIRARDGSIISLLKSRFYDLSLGVLSWSIFFGFAKFGVILLFYRQDVPLGKSMVSVLALTIFGLYTAIILGTIFLRLGFFPTLMASILLSLLGIYGTGSTNGFYAVFPFGVLRAGAPYETIMDGAKWLGFVENGKQIIFLLVSTLFTFLISVVSVYILKMKLGRK